jgi:hypothetical protein
MLTGLADQKTAMRAVNDGAVFRFLAKPCSVEALEQVVREAVEYRALKIQERDLLQNTLGGVIRLLNDLLTFIDPDGIGDAARMRYFLREIGKRTGASTVLLELAALLKGVGRLSLPLELLLKMAQGDALTPLETKARDGAADVSIRLLRQIPRFERVSLILEGWRNPTLKGDEDLQLQVKLFSLAVKLSAAGEEHEVLEQVVERIRPTATEPERLLLDVLSGVPAEAEAQAAPEGFEVKVRELCAGHRLLADVKDKNGKLLLKRGFVVSPAVVERVRNHHVLVGIAEPLRVNERIPTRDG